MNNILININRNIAAGLQDSIEFTKKQRAQQEAQASAQPHKNNEATPSQQSPYGAPSLQEHDKTDIDI